MVMLRCMLSIFIILFWPILHAMAANPDTPHEVSPRHAGVLFL